MVVHEGSATCLTLAVVCILHFVLLYFYILYFVQGVFCDWCPPKKCKYGKPR